MPRINTFTMLLIAATLSMPAFSATEEAIATVNGVTVPKSRFDLLLTGQTSQGQEDTPAFREELREIMITREVLAQEAMRRQLDEKEESIGSNLKTRNSVIRSITFATSS